MSDSHAPTVLVVDDNEASRYATAWMLRKAGFSVTEAATGEEALRLARAKPDVIVLDVNMPDMDGLEVCRRIKRDPETSSVLVVHLSASFVSSEAKTAGLNAGADGYLVEPVDPQELEAYVRALLRIHHAEDAARAAAREWQTTFDAIRDGTLVLSASDTILRCNSVMSELLDASIDAIAGRPLADIASPRLVETARALCAHARARKGRAAEEIVIGDRWFSATADPVPAKDGSAASVVFTIADITERKRAETERDRLLAQEQSARTAAQAANRAKDEFLATLSHELRTPLNSILGWAAMLRSEALDKAQSARAVETIERNARTQLQLIEDILDVSRIVSGKLQIDFGPVALAPILESAGSSVSFMAAAKGIEMVTSFDCEATVSGDANRLEQVFSNVMSNAVKFTPRGGRVEVSLVVNDSRASVVVSDSGPGISPEFLPHVFERFRQADASTKRSHGGLGLGLAIARHIVDVHGGTIEAASPGALGGATLTVSLPTIVDAPPCDEARTGGIAASGLSLAGIRVLVAEDDRDTRELLGAVLERVGATVDLCDSVAQAVAAFDERRPDVVVSDLGMPGEDGYDLIRQLRSRETGNAMAIPAVALTAFASEDVGAQAREAGYQLHATKPFEPVEFVNILASLVGMPVRSEATRDTAEGSNTTPRRVS